MYIVHVKYIFLNYFAYSRLMVHGQHTTVAMHHIHDVTKPLMRSCGIKTSRGTWSLKRCFKWGFGNCRNNQFMNWLIIPIEMQLIKTANRMSGYQFCLTNMVYRKPNLCIVKWILFTCYVNSPPFRHAALRHATSVSAITYLPRMFLHTELFQSIAFPTRIFAVIFQALWLIVLAVYS